MFDVHLLITPEPSQGIPMKRLLTAIAVAVFVIYPSVSFASYIIHLKSGHSFQTERYWEEGGEIKFKRYGGVIGIRKGLVKDIEEVEELPREKEQLGKPEATETADKPEVTKEEVKEPEIAEKREASKQELNGSTKKPQESGKRPDQEKPKEETKEETNKKAEKIDVVYYQREKRILMENYQEARQRLKQAREVGNKAEIRKAKKEIKGLEKEISDLALKLKDENGGVLPPWWFRIERKEQVQPPQDQRE